MKSLLHRFTRGEKKKKNKSLEIVVSEYIAKQQKYCFEDCNCVTYEQFEASITRLYHTVEKGLSYLDYRPGFGRGQILNLILSLEQFSQQYDTSAFFYRTALCCLQEYIRKNREAGMVDSEIENRVHSLPGSANECGGSIIYEQPSEVELKSASFDTILKTRHSIRHFSDKPVEVEIIHEAIKLAQYTPSACNRQGWKTRIVVDKSKIEQILANQNGNRGFGHEIDKLLLITSDLRTFQKDREVFQVFIDGGMYAENVLNALYYYGVGSIPLSASLTAEQEVNIRQILEIDDAEMLILFVGVGNYPEQCLTTKSERKVPVIEII